MHGMENVKKRHEKFVEDVSYKFNTRAIHVKFG